MKPEAGTPECKPPSSLRTIDIGDKMTTKDAVIEMIRKLPDDATVDEIMAELYARRKIEEGLRQLDGGQGVSHEEAKRSLAKWLE